MQQPLTATTNTVTDESSSSSSSSSSSPLLPSNYQEVGQALVAQAAASCGILPKIHNDNDTSSSSSSSSLPPTLSLEWKADTLVVTVWADNVYVSNPVSEQDGDILSEVLDDDDDDEMDEMENSKDTEFLVGDAATDDDDNSSDDGVENDNLDDTLMDVADTASSIDSTCSTSTTATNVENGIDMVLLTRAIQAALDSDPVVGAVIASRFGLQVTTPGASDVLTTSAMFRAYAGFEVIVSHQDAKTKSLKTIVGRLVERNETFLVLNIKGRVKKLKTSDVVSVRLPKAKKEKGVS
jgi:ribosome maturation factor RimP